MLRQLKQVLRQNNIKYYLLPKNDEFMNTNLPSSKDRLFSFTGFTGSNGFALVSSDSNEKSMFVTDSRYEL
jgi:hypothetical protein